MAAKKSKKSGKKSKASVSIKASSPDEPIPVFLEPARGAEALLLHYVVNNNAFALARLFQTWPNLDINRQERDGRTALHFAVELEQTRIVKLLLEAGAKTNLRTVTGKTPLMQAIQKSSKEIAQVLIRNTNDINQADRHQLTALHLAVQKADPVFVKMLIQGGADTTCKDSEGRTAWHWANYLGHQEITRLLPNTGEQPDVWEQYQTCPWFHQAIQSLQISGKSKKSGGKKAKK